MKDWRYVWSSTGAGGKLIIVNALLFVVLYIPLSFFHLLKMDDVGDTVMSYLVLPGDLQTLLFRPWTLLTHLFVHTGILHILFNMITLNFSYVLFNRYLDDTRFVNLYFVSGFAGAAMFILAVNVFPVFDGTGFYHTAAGASAATLGVMVAICSFRPNDLVNLFGAFTIKLKWIALVFVVLDIIQIRNGNEGGHLAHLGGALFGFVWALQLKQGNDLAAFFGKFINLFKFGTLSKKRSPLKVAYAEKQVRDKKTLNDREKQMRVDEILDKISKSGYDSLSKSEKALLFELSKEK